MCLPICRTRSRRTSRASLCAYRLVGHSEDCVGAGPCQHTHSPTFEPSWATSVRRGGPYCRISMPARSRRCHCNGAIRRIATPFSERLAEERDEFREDGTTTVFAGCPRLQTAEMTQTLSDQCLGTLLGECVGTLSGGCIEALSGGRAGTLSEVCRNCPVGVQRHGPRSDEATCPTSR